MNITENHYVKSRDKWKKWLDKTHKNKKEQNKK